MCFDAKALLSVALVIACSAQGTQVGWVKTSTWCMVYGLDVIYSCCTHTTNEGVTHHAAVVVSNQDTLA
jgi:hypothetical protein